MSSFNYGTAEIARKFITLVLGIILITGTITSFYHSSSLSSSSFIKNVQAQSSYYYSYDGGIDYNNKSEKDNSKKTVNLNKIKCINDNVNINGVNTGNIKIGNKGQLTNANDAEENYLDTSSFDSGYGETNYEYKDLDCIINNNNNNTDIKFLDDGSGNQTIPPPPEPPIDTTETLTVIKNVDCQADPATCEQNPIVPSQFNIIVEGNNPSDTNFPGSTTGTNVELETGPYSVIEEGLDPVIPQICTNMGYEAGSTLGNNLFICTNFSEDCEGDITIGTPQTCTIDNVLVETPVDTETLTVIKNTRCDTDPQTCQANPIQSSDFIITIQGNNPSQNNFPGSATGTNVEIEAGTYSVSEEGLDPVTPELCTNMGYEAGSTFGDDLFICTNFSDGCEGDMTIGTPQTCTIDNVLVETLTETLTVFKNTDCQADTQTCQANPIQSSDFTITIDGNDPSQNNFPGSSTGTDVELEAGPYSVSEQGLETPPPEVCTNMGYEAGSTFADDLFICTNFSDGCDGEMTIGTPQTCTIDNVLVETPTETLTVIKNTDCQADPATCEQISINPSNFTITIDGNDPSQNNFPGSATGTNVELEAGPYNVTEQGLDPVIPQICTDGGFEAGQDASELGINVFICTNFSDECEGNITIGNPQTCTIENVLVQGGVGAISINKDWFVCDNLLLETDLQNLATPYADCTTIERNFQDPDSGQYIECMDDQDCPFIANTGLNIEITGNSPTPTTIPALIGTTETVDIGEGPFQISESLSNESQSLFTDFRGNSLRDIAYDPVNQRMYVTDGGINTVSVLDTTTNTVIGTPIPVGNSPFGIAYDPVNQRMYVTNVGSNTVSVISTTTNTVIGTIPVGLFPVGITYDPVNQRMYVVNSGDDNVSVISTTTNTVIGTPIPVGFSPREIAYDPVNQRMYVTNLSDNTVSVISTTTNTVIGTPIPVGNNPFGISYDPVNQRMYVVNNGDNNVSVISTTTNTVIGTPIPVGFSPLEIAYDPVNQRMYVTNGSRNVSVINTTTNTVIGTIPVGSSPFGIAYDPVDQRMYVTKDTIDNLSIINTTTNTIIGTPIAIGDPITIGNSLRDIAYDPVNQRMYVVNIGSDSIFVIDTTTNTVIGTPIPVGNNPWGIAYDSVNQRMYVTSVSDNTVSVISTTTNTVIGTPIPVGNSPFGIAYDPVNQRMYVVNQGSNNISVISTTTNTVIGTPIPVGNQPLGIAYDPVNQRMYVTNLSDNTVSVISTTTNTVIGTPIPVGNRPSGIAYDPVNQRMYVSNLFSNSVSVISTTTNTVVGTPIPVGNNPREITYDPVNQRMYVITDSSYTVYVIDTTTNTVIGTPIPVGNQPLDIAYDPVNQRMYVTNSFSASVSILFLSPAKVCQDSGFGTGEIRTYQSNGQTIEQITCVNFVGECSGEIEDGETKECTIQNYAVRVLNVTSEDGEIQAESNMQQQQPTDSPIMSQAMENSPKLTSLEKQPAEDSPALTAMEKITKLKTQWLDLLP